MCYFNSDIRIIHPNKKNLGRTNAINNDASVPHVTNNSGWLSQNKNKTTYSSKILFALPSENVLEENFNQINHNL